MKKRKVSKKGISPMVATVLLIAFVIAIILLILLWGKNYIQELAEKRGALSEKQQECTKVQLDVVKSCWRGDTAELVIRNKANIPVHKFIFRAVGDIGEPVEKYGKKCGVDRKESCKLGGLETKEYADLVFTSDVGKINNIDIIPHLRVALGHYVPCSKQKIRTRLSDNC